MDTYEQTKTTLYLGRNKPDGNIVTTDQLTAFLRETVSPRFPGFTVQHAQGYWEGESERTAVLTIIHKQSDGIAYVDEIAREYCRAFDQSAVLQETSSVHVVFQTRHGVQL